MKLTYRRDPERQDRIRKGYLVYAGNTYLGKVWQGTGQSGYYDAWRARSVHSQLRAGASPFIGSTRRRCGEWLWHRFAVVNPYEAQVIERRSQGCSCDPDYTEPSGSCKTHGYLVTQKEGTNA